MFRNKVEEAWAEIHLPYPSLEIGNVDRAVIDLILDKGLIENGSVVWDGGAGNLNFAINFYHAALQRDIEIRAIIASNINKLALE